MDSFGAAGRWLERAALAGLIALGVRHGLVPPSLPEERPAPYQFSTARARSYVRVLARAPRPPGSAEHERARRWLLRRLVTLGADTLTQEALQLSPRSPKAALVRNVAGRIRGRAGGPAVLLAAHYDGQAATRGAGDDASGVAIVLEVLRALHAGPPPEHDVIALFTDAEEEGMLGARAFVRGHPWRGDVGVVINVEARGAGGRSLMFETGSPNLATIAAYAEEVPAPTTSSLFYALYQLLPNDTDFTEFRSLGVPGLNFAFIGDVAAYHTPLDTAGRLDLRSFRSQGVAVLELARRFAQAGPPADTVGGGSAVFLSAPAIGVAWWPLAYTWPLLAATAFLLAAAVAFGRHRRRFGRGGFALGVGGAVLAIAVAMGAALATRIGLGRLLARGGAAGVLETHPALALAPLLLALAVVLGLVRLARRWVAPEALAAGAGVVWLVGAAGLALKLPAGSYLGLVPLGAVAAGVLLRALLSEETGPPWARWLPALAILPVVLPLFPLLYLGLGTGRVPTLAMAGLAGLTAWSLAPLAAGLDARWWWVVPGAASAAALGCAGWALRGAHHSPAWPRPANVTVEVKGDAGAFRVARLESGPDSTRRIRVVPPRGTRRLEFTLERPPLAARLGGLELPEGPTPGGPGWSYALVAPPDTGAVLEFRPADPAAVLGLRARLPGLPPGTPRPPGTMPVGTGDETVVVGAVCPTPLPALPPAAPASPRC